MQGLKNKLTNLFTRLVNDFKNIDWAFVAGVLIMLIGTGFGYQVEGVFRIFTFDGKKYDYLNGEFVTMFSDTFGQMLIFYWLSKRVYKPLIIHFLSLYMADLAFVALVPIVWLNPFILQMIKVWLCLIATGVFVCHCLFNNRNKE